MRKDHELRLATQFHVGGHKAFLKKVGCLLGKGCSKKDLKETRTITMVDFMDCLSKYKEKEEIIARIQEKRVLIWESLGSLLRKPILFCGWEKPRAGFYKVNFDGSFNLGGVGGAGFGVIIRDDKGDSVFEASGNFFHVESSYQAELMALVKAAESCVKLGFKKIVIEGDNKRVIHELMCQQDMQVGYREVFDYLNELLVQFDKILVNSTCREANAVADFLCTKVSSEQEKGKEEEFEGDEDQDRTIEDLKASDQLGMSDLQIFSDSSAFQKITGKGKPDDAGNGKKIVSPQVFVAKSKILVGGQGLGTFKSGLEGGFHIVKADQVEDIDGKMLGLILVTKQTGSQGKVVSKVCVFYDHRLC